MKMAKRKPPTQHKVRAHQRKGEHGKKVYVRAHVRGSYFSKTPEERKAYHKEHPYLMPKDEEKTIVIFRKYVKTKWTPEYGVGDIIALFPDEVDSPGYINSYQHVGQHGSADYNTVMRMTKPAKPSEYAELKEELESMGYNLEVKQKRTVFGAELRY